jgi:integrase
LAKCVVYTLAGSSTVPRPTRIPTYRLHKPTDQAIVVIRGRIFYLGRFGSIESRAEYQRLLAEWLALGPGAPAPRQDRVERTVGELILAYWRYCQAYYVKDGRPTDEVGMNRQALRPVRQLYGHTLAKDFGPLTLLACREKMVELGWCRTYINAQVGRVRRMFRWATANELLPVTVHQALTTVSGLRRGRTAAKESAPVRPVSDESVEKTLPHLPPVVAAMVRVQRLTGMRPQEVVGMRAVDLDMSDPACWVYRPGRHKTEHHDRERIILIGPQARAILEGNLRLDISGPLFSPMRSEAGRNEERRAERKTKLWPSDVKAQARK